MYKESQGIRGTKEIKPMNKAKTRFQFYVEKFKPGKVRIYFYDNETKIRLNHIRKIKPEASFKNRWKNK